MLRRRRVAKPGDVRLRLAGLYDVRRYVIISSDSAAQRWLGWKEADVSATTSSSFPWSLRHADEAGPRLVATESLWLAGLARSTYVGGISLTSSAIDSGGNWRKDAIVIGAVVVADLRGQGFGTRLFKLGAAHAHDALGMAEVLAGCEDGNDASALALQRAGFEQIKGPPEHTLPNGRVIRSLWFLHQQSYTAGIK